MEKGKAGAHLQREHNENEANKSQYKKSRDNPRFFIGSGGAVGLWYGQQSGPKGN